MSQRRRPNVNYESFWVAPHREVPTWQGQRARYNFGGANPGPDVFPAEELAEAARAVILEERNLIPEYPPTYGPKRLRELVVEKMRRHRGIAWPRVEDVLATNGSAQGILLGLVTLAQPGDVVVADRFFYHGAVRTFRGHGVEVVSVEGDEDGMRMDLLEDALRSLTEQGKRAKFIYTIPSPQNPDGTIMPIGRRRQMLALAEEYDTLIMEDDCYVDQTLEMETMPAAIASLDGSEDRVIYIATFSKIIAPGVRSAWVTAAPPLLERMAAYKQDVGNDYLSGLIVAKYLEDHMDDRIDWLNVKMRQKRDTMVAALGEQFGPIAQLRVPAGGMFLWLQFPEATDMLAMQSVAQEAGVRYTAGPQFSFTGEGKNYARLNYSFPTLEEITDGIEMLAGVLRKERAFPE